MRPIDPQRRPDICGHRGCDLGCGYLDGHRGDRRTHLVPDAGRLGHRGGITRLAPRRQLPDGTVIWTSPTGHTYTTKPVGSLVFPVLAVPASTLVLPAGTPRAGENHGLMMPARRRSRAKGGPPVSAGSAASTRPGWRPRCRDRPSVWKRPAMILRRSSFRLFPRRHWRGERNGERSAYLANPGQ
jgi:hypothetical protein